jgi:Fic family protein
MPRTQIEKKVADYLRKSQALEDHWQRPITAEQLQAEMNRMAANTNSPRYCANSSKHSGATRLLSRSVWRDQH